MSAMSRSKIKASQKMAQIDGDRPEWSNGSFLNVSYGILRTRGINVLDCEPVKSLEPDENLSRAAFNRRRRR